MDRYELEFTAQQINNAKGPLDVFGHLVAGSVDEKLKLLTKRYRPLVKMLFPDAYSGDPSLHTIANAAFKRLSELHDIAEVQIRNSQYGVQPDPIEVTIQGKRYTLERIYKSGDMADLYRVDDDILKIARSPDDDDLLLNEDLILEKFRAFLAGHQNGKIWLQTVPENRKTFRLKTPDPLRVNILDFREGFVDGCDVLQKKGPIDARTLGWMWKRTIGLINFIGHGGYAHCAVLPPHLLFFPDNASPDRHDMRKHAVHLVDWCYATPIGKKVKAWCPEYVGFYPPEILNKQPVNIFTDYFMAAKTMIHLTGGTTSFPSSIPSAIATHIQGCLHPDPAKRMPDHKQHMEKFSQILEAEFGKPKWHDFIMPTTKKEGALMGGGRFDSNQYYSDKTYRSTHGIDDFTYSRTASTIHASLDPHRINSKPGGKLESRDSAEHPNSNAVLIALDVTGSNIVRARQAHATLPNLMALLPKYLPDPQVAVAANDDFNVEPEMCVQISEFESDNRIDEHIRNLKLVGNGGANAGESYDLLLYAASKTSLDCFEKRKRKGYLVMYCDEPFFARVSKQEVQHVFGDKITANIPIEDMIAQVQEQWHTYILWPHGGYQNAYDQYLKLFDEEHVIVLQHPDKINETTVMIIGANEDAIDEETAVSDLVAVGATVGVAKDIAKSLVPITRNKAVARVSGGNLQTTGTKASRL